MSLAQSLSGFSRRELLRVALASTCGIGCSGLMARLVQAAQTQAIGAGRPKKACILLWMSGGPSQLETLDPKPGHENGGPTKSIRTSVEGIHLSENLPMVAGQMKDMALLRTMRTTEGDHGRATQLMQTGYRPMGGAMEYPVLGSLVSHRLLEANSQLPGYISISGPRFSRLTSGFLGPKYAPLLVSGNSDDPNARANLTIENLSPSIDDANQIQERQQLLGMLRNRVRSSGGAAARHASIYDAAIRMVETRGEGAFDLDQEPATIRDAYGRNRFGQGCLLARRLVERGVPFVEVSLDSVNTNTWDSHVNNFASVKGLCEVLDPAWATLLKELRERGLLDSTLVLWMGEFGRTPKINGTGGRDHFPDAWSVGLAGAGLRGGQVVGKTSDDGMEIVDRPTSVGDLFATILELLGIDAQSTNMNGDRPVAMVENGKVISEIL